MEDQIEKRKRLRREKQQRWRKRQNEEVRQKIRRYDVERRALKRAQETEEERDKRRAARTASQSRRLARETPEQAKARRAANSLSQANRRAEKLRLQATRELQAASYDAHINVEMFAVSEENNVSADKQYEATLDVKHENSEPTHDCRANWDLPSAEMANTETATTSPQLQLVKVKEEPVSIKTEPCDHTENENYEEFDLKSENFEDEVAENSQNIVQAQAEDVSCNIADFVSNFSADLILKSEQVDLGCDCIEHMPDSRLQTADDGSGPIYENKVECTKEWDPFHRDAVDAGIPNGIATDLLSGQAQTIKVKMEGSITDVVSVFADAFPDRLSKLPFNLDDFDFECNCAENTPDSGTNKKSDDYTADSNLSERRLSQCDVDGRTSENATSTKSHIDDKLHTCNVCKRKYIPKTLLRQHMFAHINEIPEKYKMYQKQFGGNRCLYHMFFTHSDQRYKCKQCERSFSHASQLSEHKVEHSLDNLHKCNLCERIFTQMSHLNQHMVVHTGEKPFKCSLCPSKYSARGSLNKHMNVHTRKKNFKCKVCDNEFFDSIGLNRHLLIHNLDEPFTCHVCKVAFKKKRFLNSHMMIHRNEKLFGCTACGKKFSRNCILKRHMSIHGSAHTDDQP